MPEISGLTIAEIPDLARHKDLSEEVTSFLIDTVWRGYIAPEIVRTYILLGHTVTAFDPTSNLIGAGVLMVNRRQTAELEALGVLPKYRGLGVGGKLIRELEDLAANHDVTKIELIPGPGSRRFYENRGYVVESPVARKVLK